MGLNRAILFIINNRVINICTAPFIQDMEFMLLYIRKEGR